MTHWRPAAILVAAGLLVLVCFPTPLRADEPLRLYAAGSLRRALSEVSAAFTEATGIRVQGTFGASGLLRERLRVIELPPALSVGADYGVTALTGLRQADAARLIAFLLSSPGQAILRRHGFSSPGG